MITHKTARRREFRWMSSICGSRDDLDNLDRAMARFYTQQSTRAGYQAMVDADTSAQPVTEEALRNAILGRLHGSVLEVGCGSGRIYCHLISQGFSGSYTGLEMSPEVIDRASAEYSEAKWVCGSIYTADLLAASYDVVFAYFVLEHCVFPADALSRMVALIRPGGAVILVFPDFVEMRRFGSQALGLVGGSASACLRRGDVRNAFMKLYDSRIRLPRALRKATSTHGPFPVNLSPRCLAQPENIEPDVDAVYISSKREVAEWASSRGFSVRFPAGIAGHFCENVLIEFERSPSTKGSTSREPAFQ